VPVLAQKKDRLKNQAVKTGGNWIVKGKGISALVLYSILGKGIGADGKV